MASRLPRYLQCVTAVSAGCLSGALIALCFAAPAIARTRCWYYGPPDNVLTIRPDGVWEQITRQGQQIVVKEYRGPSIACSGDVPTVLNTDTIRIVRSTWGLFDLVLARGPYAPGATPEAEGTSEIEIEFVGPSFVTVLGTRDADAFEWAPGVEKGPPGLNLNPEAGTDRDVDVTPEDRLVNITAEGRGGNDSIVPAPAALFPDDAMLSTVFSTGGPGRDRLVAARRGAGVLVGGPGGDTLLGGAGSDTVDGGGGNDQIRGAAGPDVIGGGPGHDLIRGGPGRDQIDARDASRDRVRCGAGRDRVTADRKDRLRGCEAVRR